MQQSMPSLSDEGNDKGNPSVLIIDALELRRAAVVSLLKPWADSGATSIVAITPRATSLELSGRPLKMIVLVIGALGVGDPEPQSWITSLSAMYADVPLVLVSDREEPIEVVAAFEAGACGFIPTSIAPSVAMQAFTFIMSGGSFFPPALMHAMRARHGPEKETSKDVAAMATASVHYKGLTVRQQEVLERLRQGESNKLIGRQLKMRESTVKVHIRQIMLKLGATNRTQAALSAIHQSLPAPSTDREGLSPSVPIPKFV